MSEGTACLRRNVHATILQLTMEPANDAVDSVNDVVESVKDAVESVNDAVESVIDDIEEEVEQTMDESGGEDGCCRDNKACLRASLIVGGSLLFTDIILAIVALSSPEAVGISEDDALSKGQRGFLGFITLIIIIEGFVIATCDWCEYFITYINSSAFAHLNLFHVLVAILYCYNVSLCLLLVPYRQRSI